MNFNINTNITSNIKKITFKSHLSKENEKLDNKLIRQPNKDTFNLSVGYVNDIHGQTNNMIRILSGISGDLILSGGDNDIGDEKNKSIHNATVEFLNIADVKASALGNHELDTTQLDLIDSIKKLNTKILCANVKKTNIEDQDSETVKKEGRASFDDVIKKSEIINIKGQNIGLIGASPMDMLERLTHPSYHTDCQVDSLEDTIKELQEEVNKLKEKGINKIFLVSHLGNFRDKIIAEKTDGIDVIIGGHTHELLEGIKEGENLKYSISGEPVIITEAGKNGSYFGKLNLSFDKDGIITKAQNNLGETRLFHKNMIHQHLFEKILGKPEQVGYIKEAPAPPKTLIEENPHANFICDAMKAKTDSDIAIWHNCGVRNFFHPGNIDSSDVKDISPFLDYVEVANVSEKRLVNMFKTAIKTTFETSGFKPGLFAVSGLDYTVDRKNGTLVEMNYYDKNGNKHSIDINNPSETKTYKLATDEFLMNAGADFQVLAPKEEVLITYPYDKDVITCEYIKEIGEPIVINQTGRLKFVN